MRAGPICAAPGHALAALLAAVALALLLAPASGQTDMSVDIVYAPTNVGLKPERLRAFHRTHYYQLAENPRGTLVIFHGCGRTARAFFPYDPIHCPECLGFPEHVAHTKQALARRYTVLALEPLDRRHLCFSSSNRGYFDDDRPKVQALVTKFLIAHSLTDKPVYLLGTSSGATMALKLMGNVNDRAEKKGVRLSSVPTVGGPFVLQIHGIISEESAPEDFNAADENGNLKYPYFPPTIFVGMERGDTLREAPRSIEFLRQHNVPSDIIESPIRQITPTFFSDRSPVISQEQSASLVAGMKQIGMMDADGWLLGDPDTTKAETENKNSPMYKWPKRLAEALPWLRPDSRTSNLEYRTSLVQQALNVAWARHDAVADFLTVCLVWLEKQGQADLGRLLKRWTVPNGNLTALTVRGLVEDAGSDPAGYDITEDPTEGTFFEPSDSPTESPAQTPTQGLTRDIIQVSSQEPGEDPAPLAAGRRRKLAAAQAAGQAAGSLALQAATGQAARSAAAAGASKALPARQGVTLDELERKVAEAQRLLALLQRAKVPLKGSPLNMKPLGALQTAMAKTQKLQGLPARAVAATGATASAALPLGDMIEQVLQQLQELVQQLRQVTT